MGLPKPAPAPQQESATGIIRALPVGDWSGGENPARHDVQALLENGQVPYFPHLPFPFHSQELELLSDRWSDGKSKNINMRPGDETVRGAVGSERDLALLRGLISRFAQQSKQLVSALMPGYVPYLAPGGTSFRPVEIRGRKTSWRKDDTRLHVDAFPSNPTRGTRLLRVFTNVHPGNLARSWRVGEPFEDFAKKFLPSARMPLPGQMACLHAIGITKKRRTAYDHLMLQMHDNVKADAAYQKNAPQQAFDFPPGSTWLVFSDQVLHAAMAGQFMMEQTFYLPPEAIKEQSRMPLRVLERMKGRGLLDNTK